MKKIKIVVTGGGSGGHIYPIIPVIDKLNLRAQEHGIPIKIIYIGAPYKFKDVLKTRDIKVFRIFGAKFRRYFSIRNIIDIPLFIISIFQAFIFVILFRPDVVFSKGGSGSFPVVFVSWLIRVPVVMHESDSVISLTSKLSSKFIKIAAVSFKSTEKYFIEKNIKTFIVGNPIRDEFIYDKLDSKVAKKSFGFEPNLPLLLVVGGSQGAEYINNLILNHLKELLEFTQILHQAGSRNVDKISYKVSSEGKNMQPGLINRYRLVDIITDISAAYSASDIVVSRAGAGGIFEVAVSEKPAILIPLPSKVSTSQQEKNAEEYSNTGAAIILEQGAYKMKTFVKEVSNILEDSSRYDSMSSSAKSFAKPDASLNIADIILSFTNL